MTLCPFNGPYFLVFDAARGVVRERGWGTGADSMCAPLAGAVAAAATNPMDLVKVGRRRH